WLATKIGPFQSESLRYLGMSYATAPNEAWVALRRSPLGLGLYPVLTPELRAAVLEEFAGLVRSHLYTQAAAIAANTTPIRERQLWSGSPRCPCQIAKALPMRPTQRGLPISWYR